MLLLEPFPKGSEVGRSCPRTRWDLVLSFLARSGFSTLTLAYWVDSLVRVSRRVGKSHFGRVAHRPLRPRRGFPCKGCAGTRPGGFPHGDSLDTTSPCLSAAKKPQSPVTDTPGEPDEVLVPRRRPVLTRRHRDRIITLLPLPSQRFQVF